MIELYTDGASAGNPGLSGIGIFLTGEGRSLKISEPTAPCDNHTAEFRALIRGLEEAAALTTGMLSVRSDSQLVVQAVEKEFVKNPSYKPLLAEVLRLAAGFDFFFIKWIPDSANRAADALAREAIHKQRGN
ncbi:ribonuclease H [Sporosarcina sp. NCCP-2716]|uniref:ribonuclease HI family protein n=1 Tax=Sporosarcina sp. NCCP-2716 TaxID=2943679 RepID=UPI00203BCADF|nr:ribonuclease HI family protein [Sporosarcina sp. NCCP-2716]GKV67992.1 ribonuclease H [Sporosarcina sp. NCCP-2716]